MAGFANLEKILEKAIVSATNGAWYLRKDLSEVLITGKDTIDFLNRICAQKLTDLGSEWRPSAILHANGGVRSLFWICRGEAGVKVRIPSEGVQNFLSILDFYNFGEDVKAQNLGTIEVKEFLKIQDNDLKSDFNGSSSIELSRDEYALLKWKFCKPELGYGISEGNIILEAAYGDYVHRNKGCYPGQEVVERIYTYGNVAKKIIPVLIEGDLKSKNLPLTIATAESKTAGELLTLNELAGVSYGFACVKRLVVEKKQAMHLEQWPEVSVRFENR